MTLVSKLVIMYLVRRYNMKIKTYPLQFTEEYLKYIEEVAKKQGKTIKDFILEAIKEKIERR